MTHKAKLKGQFSYNRKQVLWLTGISIEHYNDFITDTAKAFVDKFSGVINTDALLLTPFFLSWWVYTWNDADENWILPALYTTDNNRYAEYRVLHQYVFDTDCNQYKQLIADFKSLLEIFVKEVKQHA